MQICVQDVFVTNFFKLMCYDTVSWYDTILTSLLINYGATSDFCMHVVYDTSYDTPIVSSLSKVAQLFPPSTELLSATLSQVQTKGTTLGQVQTNSSEHYYTLDHGSSWCRYRWGNEA
jgi:hypothetical protein